MFAKSQILVLKENFAKDFPTQIHERMLIKFVTMFAAHKFKIMENVQIKKIFEILERVY